MKSTVPRTLQGEITMYAPRFSMGLTGYYFYPTGDGETDLPLIWSNGLGPNKVNTPQHTLRLTNQCPGSSADYNWHPQFVSFDVLPCANDNPYSPRCRGSACTHINILPGGEGEFYISRVDNYGNEVRVCFCKFLTTPTPKNGENFRRPFLGVGDRSTFFTHNCPTRRQILLVHPHGS